VSPRGPLCALLVAASLAGCASEVFRTPVGAPAAPVPGQAGAMVLVQSATIKLSTAYDRTLAAGSRWRLVGTIPQGTVYCAAGGVFTLEGANIHEACLVLDGESLVGFYLPVEQAYSPLVDKVRLSVRNQ
jgi:hypothetical protein